MTRLIRYFLCLLTLSLGSAAAAERAPVPELTAFVNKYCVECHGKETQEAGLRLDTLGHDFHQLDSHLTWIKSYDKVRSRQMPPADSTQPTDEERARITQLLQQQLHTASAAQQKERGRVGLRRLNRAEYENSLADLVGLHTPVQELLPEDGTAAGFDKVAAALDISPAHMARYLTAADQALRLAMTRNRKQVLQRRYTGREWVMANRDKDIGSHYLLDGDAAVLFTSRRNGFQADRILVPGQYTFRISCSAVNSEKPLSLYAFFYVLFDSNPPVGVYLEAPPGKPMVHEYTFNYERGGLTLVAPELPDSKVLDATRAGKPLAEIQSPGIRVEWFELIGPAGRDWPPESHRALFGDRVPFHPVSAISELQKGKPLGDLSKLPPDAAWMAYSAQPPTDIPALVQRFCGKAFRRPVTAAEVQPFVDLALQRFEAGYEFNEALRVAYKAILCDSRFLYLMESAGPLDDHALAARLSYFLWSAPPDDELRALADAGKLRQPTVLREQTERLLNSPRVSQFRRNFLGQWMSLRKLRDTFPDQRMYPEYDELLHWSMEQETNLFFAEILGKNLSLLTFVDSDFLMLNERLAQHYGVEGIQGRGMRKVPKPANSPRGGLLTQAAILKVSADGTLTSPIVRGKFVLERILGQEPAPPPPNITAIEPDIRGATTIREQLAKHQQNQACAACHKHIDPPGFALECFDVIGGYRQTYRATASSGNGRLKLPTGQQVWLGRPVEQGAVLADGRAFRDINEFKKLLLNDPSQITRSLAEKLLIYATGADLQFADRTAVEELVKTTSEQQYRFRELIHAIVQSPTFRHK